MVEVVPPARARRARVHDAEAGAGHAEDIEDRPVKMWAIEIGTQAVVRADEVEKTRSCTKVRPRMEADSGIYS